MDDFQQALALIDSIKSVQDDDELKKLGVALDRFFQYNHPERGIEVLFNLYERFPDDDGYGVFWTILHGIEHLRGYEPFLKASVERKPMEFTLTMVNRLLNSGLQDTERQEWLNVLEEVKSNPKNGNVARKQAEGFINYQNKHSTR